MDRNRRSGKERRVDPGTGKIYASVDEAIADGVDPSVLVPVNRSVRRGKTERQVALSHQAANVESPRAASKRKARRRIENKSRKKNRGKK